MTKAIAVLIIVVVLYCSYQVFLYYDRVKNEEETEQNRAKAAENIVPQQLQGMPYQLESSLDAAYKQGVNGLKNWLKTYGPSIQDPRKAWIELDLCVEISKSNPAEARRIFAEVKGRIQPDSPVFLRVKKLEKSYE